MMETRRGKREKDTKGKRHARRGGRESWGRDTRRDTNPDLESHHDDDDGRGDAVVPSAPHIRSTVLLLVSSA